MSSAPSSQPSPLTPSEMATTHSTAHACTAHASLQKPHSTLVCICRHEINMASFAHYNPSLADTSHCPADAHPTPQPLYPPQHSTQSPYLHRGSSAPSALPKSRSSPSHASCSPSTYATQPASPA